MKKAVLICFSCLLFLCACTENITFFPQEEVPLAAPEPADITQNVTATLLLDEKSDEAIVAAAEYFCQKTAELSGGSLMITVRKTVDTAIGFTAKQAQFTLTDGKNAVRLHEWFQILNEPFRYKSYAHFSMSANSETVLRRLSEVSGTMALAAYYTGSNVFLSGPSVSGAAVPYPAGEEQESAAVTAAVMFGTNASEPLDALGFNAVEVPDFLERKQMLTEKNAVIEAALPELAADPPEIHGLTLTRAYHAVIPMWLLASPEFYASLAPVQQAVVLEASACLSDKIDNVYLTMEEDALRALEPLDYEVRPDFPGGRTKILKATAKNRGTISQSEKYFRGLLDAIE